MKKLYKARWLTASLRDAASVDFHARSDYEAKQMAGKIGRELGVSTLTMTLTCVDFSKWHGSIYREVT